MPGNGRRAFPQTGKTVKGLFLDYWDAHGGLAQQGYPISDQFQERSDLDGKTYIVQYFERSVIEWHPNNPDPYKVLPSGLTQVTKPTCPAEVYAQKLSPIGKTAIAPT